MNRKKMLPLAVLAGVAALLAVMLAALSAGGETEEDAGIALFSLSPDQITALAYRDDESDVALTRADDGWTLDSDPLLPIDPDAVDEILNGLTGLTALRALDSGEADAGAMGLDAPSIELRLTDGSAEHTLTVGGENRMAGVYYALLDGESLYTISTSAFVGLCKTPRQLYKAQDITDIETADAAELTLETAGETLVFCRDSEGNWTLDGEPDFAPDQDIVARMSNTICALTSEWSITSPGEDSEYGLDSPNAIVTLTANDGRSVRCVFGATAEDGENGVTYLRASSDESVVYEVAANHLNAFAYTKDSLKAATPETAEKTAQ